MWAVQVVVLVVMELPARIWSVVSVLQESLAYLLMVERAETLWSDSLMAKACRRGETVVSHRLPPPTAAIPPRSVASLPYACV